MIDKERKLRVSRSNLLFVIFVSSFLLFNHVIFYAHAEGNEDKVIVVEKPQTIKYHLVKVISSYDVVEGSGWYKEGEIAKIRAKGIVYIDENKKSRVVFNSWEFDAKGSDLEIKVLVNSPKTILATWRKEYYVVVKDDENFIVKGWFAENTELNIEVPGSTYEFLIVKKVFDRWEGSLKSNSSKLSIVVKSPIEINVIRKIDYFYTYLILCLFSLIVILPFVAKKELESKKH